MKDRETLLREEFHVERKLSESLEKLGRVVDRHAMVIVLTGDWIGDKVVNLLQQKNSKVR